MQDHSSFVNPAMVPSLSSPARIASSARSSASVREGPGGSATAARGISERRASHLSADVAAVPPDRASARRAPRGAVPAKHARAFADIADAEADIVAMCVSADVRVRWVGAAASARVRPRFTAACEGAFCCKKRDPSEIGRVLTGSRRARDRSSCKQSRASDATRPYGQRRPAGSRHARVPLVRHVRGHLRGDAGQEGGAVPSRGASAAARVSIARGSFRKRRLESRARRDGER